MYFTDNPQVISSADIIEVTELSTEEVNGQRLLHLTVVLGDKPLAADENLELHLTDGVIHRRLKPAPKKAGKGKK